MFEPRKDDYTGYYRLLIAGLLVFSLAALIVTIWVMVDFLHEQDIVRRLIREPPADASESAEILVGELRWQFRLTTLVVLNLIVTGVTVVLLARAYGSSQRSLLNIKALAGDILNSMDQAVITTDPQGVVTSMNHRGVELLNLKTRKVGLPLSEVCRAIDLDRFRIEASSQELPIYYRDYLVPHEKGTRTLRAFWQPLRDETGTEIGSILQLRDITERALMEQQVQRMERFSGLGSLAAGLHHEIKNPLSALSLHVQLFEEQFEREPLPAETRETLDVLRTEVNRIIQVLESFRSYASLDRLNVGQVDLVSLVEHQLKLIQPQATAAGIEIINQVPTKLPPLTADCSRLEQVILNLLINAIEAMPGGGRITIAAKHSDERIIISVADTGSGIPDDLRERIFDPYFTTKGNGTGMGLALCEKVIGQHGGELKLVEWEQGAKFEITLPAEKHEHE